MLSSCYRYAAAAADDSPQQIVPGIFLGDYDDANDIRKLQRLGIGAVLNVAHFSDDTRRLYTQHMPHMLYGGLSLEDDPAFPIINYFEKTNGFFDMARKRGLKVLVHCMAGISRSVTVLTAYLMASKGWCMSATLRRIQSKRPIAGPNPGFMSDLAYYELLLARNY